MAVEPKIPNNPTLLDFMQALGPDESVAELAELLNETNRILDDMTFVEGNLLTGHRFSIRTGIPEPTWRRLYQGVQPTKTTRAQVTASTGMLEAYAEVDKALADLNGNSASFRLQEDKGHIEGMSQKAARYFIYGNEANEPEGITGIMPHVNTLSGPTADQVIDAGGTGNDNGSILLVGWGTDKVYGIFPKGSKAGLQISNKGQVTAEAKDADGNTGYYEAYRTHYKWDLGFVVQDYRYIVRIANIDRSLLAADINNAGYTGAKLPDLMFEALEYLPSLDNCRPVFYMDRTMLTKLRQQMPYYTKGSTLGYAEVGGKRVADFQGVIIQRVDKMRVDEARVV